CNLSVSIVSTNVTSSGGADGTAVAMVTGAAGNVTYLWSTSSTASIINALTAGTYFVEVTDDVEPGCSDTAFVTITEPTSIIEETNGGFDFNVFPNPNNGEFVLSFDQNSGDKQTNLKVTNSLGQIIYAEALLLKQGNQQFTISLNEISTGIYYVTVGSKTKPLLIK
ncbi:MAG: T9SS type A sorting domain-containing protein, partial [Flavobacteriales bacterium]|nr:T9SS type A sorting domain-containing protein [Flavobacteriales bacterium]